MKRICILLTGLVLLCDYVGAQSDKISFNKTEHDFGVIGDNDGYVTFDFILTNNTDAPLLITNATASCGCTSPTWTREPIAPGKTGIVYVAYSPSGQRGPFNKVITVFTNQVPPLYLKIRGEVVKSESIVKKLPPEEEYPVAIGNYLLKTKELSFENVIFKVNKTITLEVFNNSDKPITQKIQKLPTHITVDFNPVIIPAKTAATIDVNLNVQDYSLYGDLSGEITLLINETRQTFPYSATFTEDYAKWPASRKASAGKINVSTSEINFSNLSSGNSKTFKISNSGKSPLNIYTIKVSDPLITLSKTNFVINPGEIAEIKVNVDNKKIKSDLSSTLVIICNDPNMPVYEVAIKATKKL